MGILWMSSLIKNNALKKEQKTVKDFFLFRNQTRKKSIRAYNLSSSQLKTIWFVFQKTKLDVYLC